MWLDTADNYAVRRSATLLNGRVTSDRRVSYRRDDAGDVVPQSWTTEEFNANGQLLRSISADVLELKINKPIGRSNFTLELPKGTSVSDQRGARGRRLLIGTQGREHEVTSAQTAQAASPEELLDALEGKP